MSKPIFPSNASLFTTFRECFVHKQSTKNIIKMDLQQENPVKY